MSNVLKGLEKGKLYFMTIEEQAVGDIDNLTKCLKLAQEDGFNVLPMIIPNDCQHLIKIIEPEPAIPVKKRRGLLTWLKESIWDNLI